MRRFFACLTMLMFVVGFLALAGPRYGGTLIYGRGGDSVKLDPADVTDGESVKVIVNIFEGLVRFKPDKAEIEPCLATHWEVSDDGLEWTFYLRKGVKFHDGTPFNADAVVFSFKRQMDPNNPYHKYGEWAYWGYMYNFIKDVVKIDDYTVKFILKRPYAPFLLNLACFPAYIVSPTAVKKYKADFFKHPVGTGPFKFVEWVKNDKIVLEAFDDYWGGRPYLDKLIFRVIPDNSVRFMELKRGSIDLMDGINPDDVDLIKRDKNLALYTQPGLNVGYLAMNMDKKPFDNILVRRAIAHAIDKKAIVKHLYRGLAVPAKNMLPPTLWGYNDEIKDYEYNPELAKKLLEMAGYPNGFETELWAMPIPRPYMPQPRKIAEAIQFFLKQVGVKVKIVTYEWGTYLQKVENGEHPMCLLGWIGDNGDPDNFLYVLLDKDNAVKGSASNVSFYRNDELHEILIKAQEITDIKERAKLYKKAQEIIHHDCPVVPIAHALDLFAARKYVKGIKINPLGIIYNLRDVWIEK